MEQLPLFLSLKDRPCLVVGGGAVATRKVRLLLSAGAAITVVAPRIASQLAQWQAARQIDVVSSHFEAGHIDGQWLVIAATSDSAVNAVVAEAAQARQVPCNVVDEPTLGSFFLPAIVDRAPLMVAIGTGGRAPVLARLMKERLDRWLPQGLGRLAAFAGRRRSTVARARATPQQRRHFWRDVLDGPIADDVLDGQELAAATAFGELLSDEPAAPTGEAYLVGAGPGDPGLLTLRAMELLQRADLVVYDRLVATEILQFARRDAELIPVGKQPDGPSTRQEDINELLVDRVQAGQRVCRLKGGDPSLFARLGEEVAALTDAGLPFQVVPGISAHSAAAAYAGIPLTLRGVSQAVVLITGRSSEGADPPDWASLARPRQTLVFYMGVGRFSEIASKLREHGLSAATPLAVIERASTPSQRITRSQLKDLPRLAQKHGIQAPAMLLIGETVHAAEPWQWFERDQLPPADPVALATAHYG